MKMRTVFSFLIVLFVLLTLNITTSFAQTLSRYMYWTDFSTNKIQRADLNGTNIEDLITSTHGLGNPAGIALDVTNRKMYWVEGFGDTSKIRRANLNGTNIEDLVTSTHGLNFPQNIVLDVTNRKMYWTDEGSSKIQRADLNGTNIEDLITSTNGLGNPEGIVLDATNRKMYWTEGSGDTSKIRRANLNGTNIEDLIISINGLGNPVGIALDVTNRKMYWVEGGGDTPKIRRADLSGINIEDLVINHGLARPAGIALDVTNGKMYWSDTSVSKIQRADLDGTNIEDLVTSADGLSFPYGFALGIPETTGGLRFTPNTIADQTFTVGTPVSLTLPSATGGTAPYTYTLDPIPAGLQFDSATQLLSGTPTTATPPTSVTYTATDTTGTTASLTFTITVTDTPTGGITFVPSAIDDLTLSVNTPMEPMYLPFAEGGTPPYTYTLDPIPAGLSFDATIQLLSGTPTTVRTTTATYTATDATGTSAALTFTIEVIGDGPGGDALDVDGDGQVTVLDLAIVALFYGTQVPAGVNLPADVNADGVVNLLDLTAVAQGIDAAGGVNGLSLQELEAALLAGEIEVVAGAPMSFSRHQHTLSLSIRYGNVAAALADVKQMTVGDVRLGKGMAVLEGLLQLLAEIIAIPEATALLANYPNPFNPETWIPYHLAKDADVTLTIYDMRGVAVRELILGYQAAGVYQSRGRAAYWDGRNAFGESVASGVYFYTLTAGDFTATRKMLIAK